MKGKLVYISRFQAIEFLMPKHYSGRVPTISYSFGWEINGELVAVCTIGKPASNQLCQLCGEKNSDRVYELNRLCRVDNLSEQLSQFVGAVLRRLSCENIILVSYSDTAMNHNGYIYQACNFIYTGKTRERVDRSSGGVKHSRHADMESPYRQLRSVKHRYIYFCTRNKNLRKEWTENLVFEQQPYPKGDNKRYDLGFVLKPNTYAVEDTTTYDETIKSKNNQIGIFDLE